MPSPHIVPTILRRQLITSTNRSDPNSFILPIRKVLINFNEERSNQKGLRNYLACLDRDISNQNSLMRLIRSYPNVEFVIRRSAGSGTLKGFYLNNNRTKTIPVDKLDQNQIHSKMELLLSSSGQKLKNFQRNPVQIDRSNEPVRGHYSILHENF
ncbi:hypothetical protein BY996DRAFT_4575407 [Phakopsora pachyrhizi]|uniref:Ribosomal protein/NADH dehydrogenase domain-containing protein n=1 Tax=Phakopsora pachyrhizi TaxID=170000 RepID=A0AAV0AD47_PHAPC|nr:hypothetical protein BY996DRAFT_4575407 [Phakopsora pachyrhizi]CAH7665930.1 hypothetical protein PPACK8108_LOCUS225 [Phakopsora pachyrhizi]